MVIGECLWHRVSNDKGVCIIWFRKLVGWQGVCEVFATPELPGRGGGNWASYLWGLGLGLENNIHRWNIYNLTQTMCSW